MITDLIWQPIYAILNAVFAALPTASLASTFGTVYAKAYDLGEGLGGWNTVLPASEVAWAIFAIVGVFFPAVVTYKLANWVWRHIPDLGGFGPGAG